MALFSWRRNPGGIRELEMMIERGLVAISEVVADRAKANLRPYRDTGAAEDSIHLNTEHLEEWPRPVVFVGTASGDGYFIHEGTNDTPYRPFLSMALDQTQRDFPKLLQQGAQRGQSRRLSALNREFRPDQGIRREG